MEGVWLRCALHAPGIAWTAAMLLLAPRCVASPRKPCAVSQRRRHAAPRGAGRSRRLARAAQVIDCEMAEDKHDIFFNFSMPFEIHDDNEILKRMGLHNCQLADLPHLVPPALIPFTPQYLLAQQRAQINLNLQPAPSAPATQTGVAYAATAAAAVSRIASVMLVRRRLRYE